MIIIEKQQEVERERLEQQQQRANDFQIAQALAADGVQGEAPPAYEEFVDDSRVLNSRMHKDLPPDPPRDDKKEPTVLRPPTPPVAGPSKPSPAKQLSSVLSTPIPSSSSSWFPPSITKGKTDVRKTVLGLVRDLVRQAPLPISSGMLDSCANACSSHGLPLNALLQEPSVEGHTPLFWAILNWSSTDEYAIRLLTQLIAHSSPLEPSTIADMRQACLALGDKAKHEGEPYSTPNSVLQRLRRNPLVFPPSGTDSILLESPSGASTNDSDALQCFHSPKRNLRTFADAVHVFEPPGSPDSFIVQIELKKFAQRMRVSRLVVSEFIARGRMWVLQYFPVPAAESVLSGVRPETVTHVQALQRLRSSTKNTNSWFRGNAGTDFPEGVWAVSLGLLEGSVPVVNGVSARIVVPPSTGRDTSHDRHSANGHPERSPSTPSSPSASSPTSPSPDPGYQSPSIPGSFGPFLSRLISSPFSASDNQVPPPTGSAVLEFKHFPFKSKHVDVDSSKGSQLVAPSLPPFPPASDGTSAEDSVSWRKTRKRGERPREKREREGIECACDVLASFEEVADGQAFDIGTHVGADGTLQATLEVRLLKPGESTNLDSGCIIC
ncbi:hypothetical protein SCHPADRAFT_853217 [Schizopora paradoxa]|uniref:Uncharacterized protein n=1 Tax=Schizopora paradoxa TaxID=27342 RepID=A0A0H2RMY7_9AGAM|nr:hypothetical protein SCHPADRAFT_853217 [Schizopora paradoxa]